MLSEKICFSSSFSANDREYCQNASELFNSKNLYIYLERFSNTIIKEVPEYDEFLHKYFNDEGYIDIWRIPHLLIDLVNGRTECHAVLLNDEKFRTGFMSYLGEFYNYCIKKGSLLSIESSCFTDFKSNMFYIRKNQFLYNLITETYCNVCEKLNNYEDAEKGRATT